MAIDVTLNERSNVIEYIIKRKPTISVVFLTEFNIEINYPILDIKIWNDNKHKGGIKTRTQVSSVFIKGVKCTSFIFISAMSYY